MAADEVTQVAEEEGAGEPERSGGTMGLVTLCVSQMMTIMMFILLIPQVVTLQTEFNTSINNVVWALIIVSIVGAPFVGLSGGLGAYLGYKRFLILCLCAILVGAVVVATAQSLEQVIAGRAIEGIGGGAMACIFGLLGTWWSGHKMRVAMAWIMSAGGVISIVTYPASSYLQRYGGHWRVLFWVMAGVCVVNILMLWFFMKETHREKYMRLDWLGSFVLVAWTVLILLPLSKANDWGWGSGKTLGMLIPGVVLMAGWVAWELRQPRPLLDLRVMRKHGVWQGVFLMCSIGMIGSVQGTILSQIIQLPGEQLKIFPGGGYGLGRTVIAVGWCLAASGCGSFVAAYFFGPLSQRTGLKGAMLIGAVTGTSYLALAGYMGALWILVLVPFIYGMMNSIGGSAAMSLMIEAVPPAEAGKVGAVSGIAQSVASSAWGALVGYVLTIDQLPISGYALPSENPIRWVAAIGGGTAVVAFLFTLLIKPSKFESAARTLDADTAAALAADRAAKG